MGVVHGHTFRQLKFQRIGGQVKLHEHPAHQFRQLWLTKLDRRQVHSHREFGKPAAAPCLELGQRRAQHPLANLQNLSAVFSNRDELSRRDGAELGVLPPQQGFHTAYGARGQAYLRLVVQLELLPFQGAAQSVFELQGAHRLGLHLGGEEAEGIAPIQLGAVHGHVGRLGQRVEVVSVLRKQRNAHGGGHRELVVVDLVRLARRLLQFARDPGCAPRICSGQKQDELITAQARDRVLVAFHGAQPFGDFHKQHIANPVA